MKAITSNYSEYQFNGSAALKSQKATSYSPVFEVVPGLKGSAVRPHSAARPQPFVGGRSPREERLMDSREMAVSYIGVFLVIAVVMSVRFLLG